MAETWFNIICLFQMYEPKHLPFFSSFIPIPILYNVMILFHFMSRSDLRRVPYALLLSSEPLVIHCFHFIVGFLR